MLNIKNETDLALSQQIANSLKEEILSGKYPPGIRIRQEDIAEQFGASRSPVREALRILEAEGLINLVAHTGAWISHLSLSECEEMYQLRERIEPLLLRLSIPHITDSLVHELQKLVLAERILFGHIRRTRLELAKHPDVFNS
ncbi:MAG: GntR family transcriptional regulator [Actinobacteria bacterium]|nr:GntR family transcriptional regulator [Actinomycetota bacterium]